MDQEKFEKSTDFTRAAKDFRDTADENSRQI